MAPISGDGWVVNQVLLRDLRVDRGALLGAKEEHPGRNDQRGLDGKDDRNLTRKGMLQHGPSLQAVALRRLDLDQSKRFDRGKQKYEGGWGDQQSIFFVFAPPFASIVQWLNFNACELFVLLLAPHLQMPDRRLSHIVAADIAAYIRSLRK
jgi:hypothetical protein